MVDGTDRTLRRWKRAAGLGFATAGLLLVALIVAMFHSLRPARLVDERLIGTWRSDADRTIAGIRQQRSVDEKQEAALRMLFGKLRVTYAETTYTTVHDGVVETNPYEVLGRDSFSVVLREVEPKSWPLEVNEFTIINFDGLEAYWLYTNLGGIQEYFKRAQ